MTEPARVIRMRRDLREPVRAVAWPAGVELRAFSPELVQIVPAPTGLRHRDGEPGVSPP